MKKEEKYLINVQKNIIQDYQKTFDWMKKQKWYNHKEVSNYVSSFIYIYEDIPDKNNSKTVCKK